MNQAQRVLTCTHSPIVLLSMEGLRFASVPPAAPEVPQPAPDVVPQPVPPPAPDHPPEIIDPAPPGGHQPVQEPEQPSLPQTTSAAANRH